MILIDILAYFSVLASLTLAPGPLSAILVAKTLAGDKMGALVFGSGIALGDIVIILLVCSGLGQWVESTPIVFTFGKVFAVVYIIWIAIWMLRKNEVDSTKEKPSSKRFWGELGSGMITCIASPQTLLLYLVLVPRLINLESVSAPSLAILLATTIAALITCIYFIVFLSAHLRQWIGSCHKRSLIDWILAGVVAGSGLLIISM